MRLRGLALIAVLVSACPHAVSTTGHTGPTADDGGHPPTEAELIRPKILKISAEAQLVVASVDTALWNHWTGGAALDVAKAAGGHDGLFTKQTVGLVRHARKLKAADERALKHLEQWLVGELLARAIVEESATVANLEATTTFSLDGKEQSWRELTRLLVNEKSAVKRRALWSASLKAAERIDAALARRDAKAKAVLATLDIPSPLELAADTREVDPETLSTVADHLLSQTELAWQATMKRLSDAELKLPVDKLTRADLPRLLKVPASVDTAFPKSQVAARAVQTLGTLGFYGKPGLTLDLAEAAKKNPLPLTVAPGGPDDVRVSFRPLGGLRDQALVLAELGNALALRHARTGQLETSRLGAPGLAVTSGELLSSLEAQPAWLADIGLTSGTDAVVEAAKAQRLFSVRRAAGTVLARLETAGLPEADARARYVEVMSRALGVKHNLEDGARWRIDTDDFFRSATQLRAAVLAEVLRGKLVAAHGETWWRKPEAGATLQALWASGTSKPAEALLGPLEQSLPALVLSFGGALAEPDGGVIARPWPRPESLADGGTDAGVPKSDAGPAHDAAVPSDSGV